MTTATSKCLHQKGVKCLTTVPRRGFREFYDDASTFSQKKITTCEVNRRIFENEFFCFPRAKRLGFTANQIDVNRPVEDRWSAYRIGGAMNVENSGFFNSSHPLMPFLKDFPGGHLFTVVDGHAGHTCAHAVNMMHADYITTAMLPHHLVGPIYHTLCRRSSPYAPVQAVELAQPYLTDPSAVMTSAEDVATSPTTTGPFAHDDHLKNWRLWGRWGPLDAVVNKRRLVNIHQMLKDRLAVSEADKNIECVIQENGNIYDHEGYLVSNGSDFSDIPNSTSSSAPNDNNCPSVEDVCVIASNLRSGLVKMDLDITSDAVPNTDNGLNKSLLRIVLSGCVATSVYIPDDLSAVYVAQIGDCGAVLGRYNGGLNLPIITFDAPPIHTAPKSFDASQWSADLLVPPHNSHNHKEIDRLQSEHPIHEASCLIAEDRLLGELMPLRAFGDIRYKLPAKVLKQIAELLGMPPNYPVCPRFYHSPPYLMPTPQVVCRRLNRARDRFIILATDGLWDMLSPEEAVAVVGQHYIDYKGEPSLAGGKDTAASRLIRTALGGEIMDPGRIAGHLSVPANVARFYRDDITALVIYPNMC